MDNFNLDQVVGGDVILFDEAWVRVINTIEPEVTTESRNALQSIGMLMLMTDVSSLPPNRRLTVALAYAAKANELRLDEAESGAGTIARHLGVKFSVLENAKGNGADAHHEVSTEHVAPVVTEAPASV